MSWYIMQTNSAINFLIIAPVKNNVVGVIKEGVLTEAGAVIRKFTAIVITSFAWTSAHAYCFPTPQGVSHFLVLVQLSVSCGFYKLLVHRFSSKKMDQSLDEIITAKRRGRGRGNRGGRARGRGGSFNRGRSSGGGGPVRRGRGRGGRGGSFNRVRVLQCFDSDL